MNQIFVWTLGDVISLVFACLIILIFVMIYWNR